MFQFVRPKFRFGLFLLDNNKHNFQKNNSNNNSHLPVVCYADTYEIKEDGSIVFYQTIKTQDDKRFKVPVLSYPHGKWDACVLLDDNNDFPVFKGFSNTPNPQYSFQEESSSLSQESESLQEISNNFQETLTDKQFFSHNVQNQQHVLNQTHGQTTGSGMPGITNQHNPQEFKKQREEWLETEIKAYIKINDEFNMTDFLSNLQKKSQNKIFKISETDVIWTSSKLIRTKTVMSRPFSDSNIQKILSLILPDIMKRQWDGKMAPILQILQEREETKNANAIDLAVWMVQNNY